MTSPQTKSSPASPRPARAGLWLRLLVGAGLLTFLFTRHATITEVAAHLYAAHIPWLLLAIAFSILGETTTAWKWCMLIRHIRGHLPLPLAIRTSYIGMFYNNFFPGSVGGDFARILLAARHAGGKARAAASIFMQRNTGLAALFIIGLPACLLWPLHLRPPGTSIPPIFTDVRLYFAIALAGYITANIILFSRTAYRRVWDLLIFEKAHHAPRTIHRLLQKIALKLQRFHSELHGYRFWLPAPIAMSVVTQILDILIVASLARALNLSIPFPVITILVTLVSLANLLPLTINGIGLRETIYVALLASHSISPAQAIALSLCHFAIIQLNAAAGGILQLIHPSKPQPV